MQNLYNVVFERAILGHIIFSIDAHDIEDTIMSLRSDQFYLPNHKDIFEAMVSLLRLNKPIDEEFLKIELDKNSKFDESIMLEILSHNPIANIDAYVAQLKEFAKKRKLLEITTSIKSMILENESTSDDVEAMISKALDDVDANSNIGSPITMEQAIYDYDHMKEPVKISTGIRKLDDMLCGGFEPAQLVHFGGEKNVGKTTILKQILFNTSVGFDSLFFSFEMPAWKMAKFTKRMKGQADFKRYRIIDTQMMKSRDVMDVVRVIKQMHRKHGIRFVLIDSKMKLTHRTFKGASEADKRGDIDAILNAAVQETGITIMMIVQISGENIKNGTMSSYGSTISDYEADMQIMMYHSKENDKSVELKVTKNRQEVKHDPIKLWLNEEEMKFEDIRKVETYYTTVPEQYQQNENKNYLDIGGQKLEISIL